MELSKAKLLQFSAVAALLALATSVFGQRTLIPFRLEDKWGVMNFFEEFIVEPKYEEVHFFAGELTLSDTFPSFARVRHEGLYGFIDQFGEEVIPPVYTAATDFNAGYARVTRGSDTYVINTQSKVVPDSFYSPASYAEIETMPPSELITTGNPEKWSDTLTQLRPNEVLNVRDLRGYRLFAKDGKYGLERNNRIFVPLAYDSIRAYVGQNFLLFLNGKVMRYHRTQGIMDSVAIPTYDEIIVRKSRESGITHILYRKEGLWGYRSNRKGKIMLRYKALRICPERPFLYEVITQNDLPGYVNPSLEIEFFSDGPLLTIAEMQPAFAEAESYANQYLENLMTEAGVDVDHLTSRIEACMASVLKDDGLEQATLYRNFALSHRRDFRGIDTLLLAQAADLYLASGLITDDAVSASPLLVAACRHLTEKFEELMEKYPKYTFTKIIPSFANKVINDISPRIIQSGLRPVLETCDFSIPAYRKIVLLHHFHFLAYSHLVAKGKLSPSFRKH